MVAPDPASWLLQFTAEHAADPAGDGRPWGDGTEMAARALASPPAVPWDVGCAVTPIVGGYEAMTRVKQTAEDIIAAAGAAHRAPYQNGKWVNGHVYIADWRFNCLRDLSTDNDWGTDSWAGHTTATFDETAIGLVRRLMQVGVQVRMLLWYPRTYARWAGGFASHIEDHLYAARLVAAENARLMTKFGAPAGAEPLGVVALDLRVSDSGISGLAASHHQKMALFRTPFVDVAFCGGVDLAYTRRDAPAPPANTGDPVDPQSGLGGDWQSGDVLSSLAPPWPQQAGAGVDDYKTVAGVPKPDSPAKTDLPIDVFGPRQSWHDQHLELHGPIVSTLEWQFAERWQDSALDVYDLTQYSWKWGQDVVGSHWTTGQVILSSGGGAISHDQIVPLPMPAPVAESPGSSIVQMWRTIPWRDGRLAPPFKRAEFTAMAGIANAVSKASNLIWIFDQYFWSQPLARLLNRRLQDVPDLHLIVVLPPFPDTLPGEQLRARSNAIELLFAERDDIADRVAVYSPWDSELGAGRGIYVHAKVQMYDGSLLVCGSANLNRRSFTGDSELACAVLDPAVVTQQQKQLWNYLFRSMAGWPDVDLNAAPSAGTDSPGKVFFDAFKKASGVTKEGDVGPSVLIVDPWDVDGARLPNGKVRSRTSRGWFFDGVYNGVLDPGSLDGSVEDEVRDPSTGKTREPDLADIVDRLERCYEPNLDGTFTWPYRRGHW